MTRDSLSKDLAEYFKALAHPTRLQILELLREEEKCVCEIVPALLVEQSNISRHLSILRKEGILSAEKRGLNIIYACRNEDVYRLMDLGKKNLLAYWNEKRIT